MSTSHSEDYAWHNDLPHVRWEPFFKNIENVSKPEQERLITDAIECWLKELAVSLGKEAGVLKLGDIRCLYSSEAERSEQLLEWSSAALNRIIAIIGEHRTVDMIGPRVILILYDLHQYYDYIDHYYPESGEFAGSGGVCISSNYVHVVVNPGEIHSLKSKLVHELTHVALAPLPLPHWLNEGVAQLMEDRIAGASYFQMNRELLGRHHAFWRKEGLQRFWNGEAFDCTDELQELSYHLAEVLTRNILADHGPQFIDFVKSANWIDAGQLSAQEVLRRTLGEIATEFLGPGDWEPQSAQE